MNQVFSILIIIIIFIIGFYFLTGSNVNSVSVEQLRSKLNSGQNIALIDVRTKSEYYGKIGHINESILIPINDLQDSINTLDWDSYDEIYTICLSGGRSAKAVNILEKNNIKATNVRGGMVAWNMLK
tara:strand:- start:1930 stop:2310 length:381 start_codon:yes stop_codon:yes gene_type:complete